MIRNYSTNRKESYCSGGEFLRFIAERELRESYQVEKV